MNVSHPFRALHTGVALVSFISVSSALAQQEDLSSMVEKGLIAMRTQNWPEALTIHTQIVERFGKTNPLQRYGARFGMIYYRKGIAETKLKKYAEAAKSFEICYKNFPNNKKGGGANLFEKLALYRLGEAYMGDEKWEEALKNFEKFLKERDKTKDKYPRGTFHLSVAICNYKLKNIPKGNDNLEIAIRNKKEYKTSETGIVSAFQALVEAAIEAKNEQAIIDFIGKHRGDLVIPPYAMNQFSPVFMRLGAAAIAAELQRAAVLLYQFVPTSEIAVEDTRARLTAMGNLRGFKDGARIVLKEKLESNLKNYDQSRRGNQSAEMIKLGVMAFIHEKNGNFRGAFAAYEQLEKYFQNAAKREDNLFNLVRTSSIVAQGLITQRYGETFLKTFPNSDYVPAVKRMMLSSLFFEGEYEICIEVAEPMLPDLEEKTPEHDICLHVLGGSKFYTGKYDEAKPLLDKHVELYPESDHQIAAMYFQASNLTRLQYWSKAGELLDIFLKKHSDPSKNVFFPFALYDRANCYYSEEKYDDALATLNRIIEEFPTCDVIDQTWNLKGNVQQTTNLRPEAEESYLKALEIADRRKNVIIAGESLFSLVALIGDKSKNEERIKEAIPYADRYWKEFSRIAPYNARVAVAQFAALDAANRYEDALDRLKQVILELAGNPEAYGLEELINSYKDGYLQKHTPEELKEHFYNFPVPASQRAARALLRVAVISVYEEMKSKAETDAETSKAEAGITVLFRELKRDFDVKDLSNYILVRVGDFLRTNTSTPREALPYYDEALSRQDQSFRFNALLGRADVYGMSSNEADLTKALEDFNRIYADSSEKSQKEFALYRIVQTHMAKKDYAEAEKQAKIYLDREQTGFSRFSPEVSLLLAQSFDYRNMSEDALAVYATTSTGASMGYIRISAPAMKRYMEILWERNKPAPDQFSISDRQGAYDQGSLYIELTSRLKDKFSDEDTELWQEVEKLVQSYEATPGIKSRAQRLKEKEEGR